MGKKLPLIVFLLVVLTLISCKKGVVDNNHEPPQTKSGISGVIIGLGGTILQTTDDGLTWMNTDRITSKKLNGVYCINRMNAIVVGDEGTVIRTTNGGDTWFIQDIGTWYTLWDVYFADSLRGIITGNLGSIFRTTDGGKSWTAKSTNTTKDFLKTSFSDKNHGTAVLRSSALHTTDGGISWTETQVKSYLDNRYVFLRGVSCPDSNIGWAVGTDFFEGGWHAVIYQSIDGFNYELSGGAVDVREFRGVHFINPYLGTVVGEGGVVYRRTPDGSWTAQVSGTQQTLNDVLFIDENRGWIVGNYGTVLCTTNGGNSWVQQTIGSKNTLVKISFVKKNL